MAIDPNTGEETDPETRAFLDQDHASMTHAPDISVPAPSATLADFVNRPQGEAAPALSPSLPPALDVTRPEPVAAPGATPETNAPALMPPPGAPVKSVTNEGSSTTTTRTVLSKEEKQAHADLQKTLGQREGLATRAGNVLGQEADLKKNAADEKLKQQQLYQPQLDKLRDDAAKEYDTKLKEKQAAQQEYAQAKPGSYWDNDPQGKKSFWSGIAMALGGFNASRTGGRNMAYEQIKDSVDRFDKLEQARIAKLKDVADTKGKNADEVMKIMENRVMILGAKKAGALENATTLLESKMSALGRPKAEIDKDDTILKLREDRQKADEQYDQALRKQISSTVVKKSQEIVGGTGPGGAADGPGQAKGIVDGRQRAVTAVGLRDQMRIIADEEKKGHALTEEDRELIQRNKMYLHVIENQHGMTDAMMTDWARRFGLPSAPKGPFDGIDPKKKRLAGASELATQKGAVLAANGSVAEGAISHARGLTDFLAPAIGPEEAARRREYIQKDLIDVNKNLVPELFRKAAGEAPVVAPPSKAFLMQQAADLKKTIDAHPNHARAPAARAHLAELYKQIKS